MKKHIIPIVILLIYIAILIKVMVFKIVPTIHVGQLMLNFGGTESGRPANFVPFKTIVPYLLGYKGWIIAGINLFGNIILLVPLGLLLPFVYRNMTWRKSLTFGIAVSLVIETLQTILHVGIFDIDDVILNVLGVMIGYGIFVIIAKWIHSKNYKAMIIAAIVVVAAGAALYGFVVYPMTHQPMNSPVGTNGDLCNGTGGNGQIVSITNNDIVMGRREDGTQIIHLTNKTRINTSTGAASPSDLKTGDRITLVGGPNPDGSFAADAIFVCATE